MEEIQTNNHEKYDRRNSEEVQDIIERMPTKFGWWITWVVLFIVALMAFFGWKVSYPDIVSGKIVINTNISPVKLVANSSGQLKLLDAHSQSRVQAGEPIAFIQNATSYSQLRKIKKLLERYNPNLNAKILDTSLLPEKISLGILTEDYYTFLQQFQQWYNFQTDKLYEKQIEGLVRLLHQQQKEEDVRMQSIKLGQKNVHYTHKFYGRDSLLFQEGVIAEARLDRTQLEFLNAKTTFKNTYNAYINAVKELRQTQTEIDKARISESEKEEELKLSLITAYNNLRSGIKSWEDKYIFKAPFDGTIQFLGFWENDQFVQAGESLFTIIPHNKDIYGQVTLPAMGAGKVKVGQEVIIKLNDFPNLEYGTVSGRVAAISLTSKKTQTQKGAMESYLVTVNLPNGLMTNYGKELPFKQEAHGSAEIITKDRRLIERLFDNLKYAIRDK